MGIASLPAPSTEAGPSAFTATIDDLSTTYEHEENFSAGVYTITVVPNTTIAKCSFVSDTAFITSQTTVSGTVVFNLTAAASKVFITTGAGGTAGAGVTIEKTAGPLTSDDIGNGTLDTINTTGTYNQTGLLGVLVYSGGEAGNRRASNPGGNGGRAGFINGEIVITNSATTVTIGAGGVGETANSASVAPTNSSFGNLVTATSASNTFPNGNGGNGGQGGGYFGNAGNASSTAISWNTNSTTGGGSGGNDMQNNTTSVSAVGSGIGTGGLGANSINASPTAATGKAAGGAGARVHDVNNANANGSIPGSGTAGVVFVLRGF